MKYGSSPYSISRIPARDIWMRSLPTPGIAATKQSSCRWPMNFNGEPAKCSEFGAPHHWTGMHPSPSLLILEDRLGPTIVSVIVAAQRAPLYTRQRRGVRKLSPSFTENYLGCGKKTLDRRTNSELQRRDWHVDQRSRES